MTLIDRNLLGELVNNDNVHYEDIMSIPTVELIKCKECDYWEKSENSLQGRCCLLQMYPTGEWFCGNAKRKENK